MSTVTDIAEVTLQMNGQQPLQVLQQLRQRSLELQDAIAKAAMAGKDFELKNLRKELRNVQRQIKEVETSTSQVDAVLARLDEATPKELEKTLKALNSQLNNIERNTNTWDAHVRKIQRVKSEIDKVKAEIGSRSLIVDEVIANPKGFSMNDIQKSIDLMNAQQRMAAQGSAEWKEASDRLVLLKKALDDVKMSANAEAASLSRVMSNLNSATPKELSSALEVLNAELSRMQVGSEAWNAQVQKIRNVSSALEGAKIAATMSSEEFQRVMRSMNSSSPEQLRKALSVLKHDLDGMATGSDAWNAQVRKINSVEEAINKARNAARMDGETMQQVLNDVNNASPEKLKTALEILNGELNKMSVGSEAWNTQVEKIESVKNALDKAKTSASVSGATMRKVLNNLNSASPRDLKNTLDVLNKELQRMKVGSEAWNIQVRNINRVKEALENARAASENAGAVMKKTLNNLKNASPRDLELTLKELNRQLQNLERNSAAFKDTAEKIKLVKAELAKVKGEMSVQMSFWDKFNRKMNEWQASLMGAIAALTGLIYAGRNAVNTYAKMEEEMANTMKYTGLTKEGVEELNDEFKRIDTRTGREELNELAQEAGRLGKNTKESVKGYVEAANVIKVALVDLGDGATQTIAKIANIFGIEQLLGTRDAMLSVGSTVNVLSQNCTASKPYIVEFTQRMAGIGAQAKMTIPQIMAYAATLDANGQKVEMSASALSRVILKLYQEPEKITQQLGLSTEKFMEAMHRSTNEGLMMFLQRLHEIGNDDALAALAPLFEDLGMDGIRLSQVLSTLAEHLDMVKWEQKEANKAFNEATSASREYNIFNNTVQAGIEKAIKRIHELGVELGEKLLPLFRHIMTSGSAMLRFLNIMVDFMIEHKSAIITATASWVAYTVAVNAASVATKGWNILCSIGTTLMNTYEKSVILLKAAWLALTGQTERAKAALAAYNLLAKSTPWGLVAAGITAAVTAIVLLVKHLNEASALEKDIEEMTRKVNEATAAQIIKVETLTKKIHDNNLSNYERIKAIDTLKEIIPEYNVMLDKEGKLINDNTVAITNYIRAIKDMARAQAAQDKMVEIQKEILDLDERIAKKEEEAANPNNQHRGGYLMTTSEKAEMSVMALKRDKKAKEDELDAIANWGNVMRDGTSKQTVVMEKVNQELYKRNKEYKEAVDVIESEYSKAILAPPSAEKNVFEPFKVTGDRPLPKRPPFALQNTDFTSQDYFSSLEYKEQKPQVAPKSQYDIAIDKRNTSLYELNKKYNEGYAEDDYHYTPQTEDSKGSSGKTDKFLAEKDWKAKEEALARISYATGVTNYEQYTKRMDEISVEFYKKELQHQDLSQTERLTISAEYREAQKKATEDFQDLTIEAELRQYNEEMANLKQRYIDGKSTTKEYEEAVSQLELKHLQSQERIYKYYTENRPEIAEETQKKLLEVQKTYSDRLLADQKAKQQEAERLAKEHEKKLEAIKKEYLGNTRAENMALYQEDLKNLTEVYQRMIASLGPIDDDKGKKKTSDTKKKDPFAYENPTSNEVKNMSEAAKEKLKIEEAYQKARIALMKKYNIEGADENKNFMEGMANDITEWLESDGGKAVIGAMDTLVSGMSSVFQQLTSIVQAELEIQTSAIEKRYDKEISAAEGNGYKVKQLEKQKERDIAKVKNDANKKMFAMQVIQAVAQTAVGAINAYSSAAAVPVIGYILAPIAAGMAVAAGALQIAALKKQQQASLAQGYSEGGFTKPGAVDEPAGIVHAGEWVASQKLLKSPEARPLINALDYAQRTNTIGSLKASDVSRSIIAPSILAQATEDTTLSATMAATAMALGSYSNAIKRLNERLDEPFVTVNTVTGDAGINKAQDDYRKLMSNKTPIRRR